MYGRTMLVLPAMVLACAGAMAEQRPGPLRASEMIGREVVDRGGESWGRISELVVDLREGRVHYAVIESGGLLGIGEQPIVYPMGTLSRAPSGEELVLEPPRQADGARRARTLRATYFFRATELMGLPLADGGGRAIGTVGDLLIDTLSGRVREVLVRLQTGAAATVAVSRLSVQGSGKTRRAVLDADSDGATRGQK